MATSGFIYPVGFFWTIPAAYCDGGIKGLPSSHTSLTSGKRQRGYHDHRFARRTFRPKCQAGEEAVESSRTVENWFFLPSASPYEILGIDPTSCSPSQLKAAFRARVKEFHPDVHKDTNNSDAIIRRVIQAYEMLSKHQQAETTRSKSLDPFEEPECEAYDLFVNETLCFGKGCPYSCVERAPHAFSFTAKNGTARAISQGHGEDYHVHLAVGQCPRRCIYYVTPSQRAILEDLLECVPTMILAS